MTGGDEPIDRPGSRPEVHEGDSSEAVTPSASWESAASNMLGRAILAARPEEPVGLLAARSRVAAGLFGSSDAPGVGRFQLLDCLSAGGMGVIYAAYDPHLERAVAVKLVHIPGGDGAEAVAEAKTLARLAHPNVVTIFDYGFADEHLYIVMELVLGETLRRWVRGKTRREVLKAYRQAGEGLAAAHAAGLIHRDFKPDNAVMGVDGRVRVLDFGLACEIAKQEDVSPALARGAGTPRYMAPEQRSAGAVTAAADQFSFCTALLEALRGANAPSNSASVPRWLQAVIDRGRATSPAERFSSMQALLHALSRDPVTFTWRWIAAGGLATAAALAFFVGRATLTSQDALCETGEARLAMMWAPDGEDRALGRIAQLSAYGRSLVPRVRGELAAYAQRWTKGYRDACVTSARDAATNPLAERRLACFERGRGALRSVADIVRTTDPQTVSDLILAVHALPDPDACNDPTVLLSDAEQPPDWARPRVAAIRGQIDEARIQIAAGRSSSTRSLVDALVGASRAVPYKPLLSEALLVQGQVLMNGDDPEVATKPLSESLSTAFAAGLPSVAVEAWARRAWARGTSVGGADTLQGLEVIEAVAANASTSQFARALLHNNLGCVYLALERRDLARAAFEQASRDMKGYSGRGTGELLYVGVNLGLATDDPVQRDQVFGDAVAAMAATLGEDHPETLDTRWLRGATATTFSRALGLLEPTCAGLELHGGIHAAKCWLEVGFIRGELGDTSGAAAAMGRAAATQGASGPRLPAIEPYRLLWQGDADRASQAFAAALGTLGSPADEPWWDRFDRAELELGLGRSLRAMGRLPEARRALSSSVERFDDLARRHPASNAPRRLARARAELVHVLAALHGAPKTIAPLAAGAAVALRDAGGRENEIRHLDTMSALTGRR